MLLSDEQAAVATLWRALDVRSDTPETWPRRRPCVVGSSSLSNPLGETISVGKVALNLRVPDSG
jgi:hypothetical protein